MLFSNSKSTLASLTAFLTLASAHVKIESPVPYGAGNGAPALDTNPLLADGSDYPCKQRPEVYKVVKNNVMAIGEPQPLTFQGQATHGGGSCQIALSKDMQPTKSSVFKVILSIEGGCPSKNPGNVGESPFGYGADKFQYTIPEEVAPGDYTLAFTWFNKIGNREMYMNCAPITVTGSKTSRRDFFEADNNDNSTFSVSDSDFGKRAEAFSSLPDMFIANIGNGCTTAASGTDLAIPEANKGKYVQRINTGPLTPPVGNCGASAPNAGAADPDPVASPAAEPSAQAPSPSPAAVQPHLQPQSQASAPAAQPSPSAHQSASVPTAQSPQAKSIVTVTATPTTLSVKTVTPTPATMTTLTVTASVVTAGASEPTPTLGGTANLQTGSCPTPGKSVCSPDGTGFGTCMPDHTVIFQEVPEGTKCDKALGVEVHARRGRIVRGL